MNQLLHQTRRHFFKRCGVGLGSLALADLLGRDLGAQERPDPMAPRPPHFAAKATNVIYLFMAGGPSQLDMFDYKPDLKRLHGEQIPQSFLEGRRFAFMDSFTRNPPRLLGSPRRFFRAGRQGTWLADCLPHLATVVDDIAIVRTVATDVFNHAPAKVFINTGSPQWGRPSLGAWVTYGIGSESRELPGFVVLQSGPRGPRGGAPLWGAGFLPTAYQGVPFRSSGEPILNLTSPEGISPRRQRQVLDTLRDLNEERRSTTGDPEIDTRIASYEMAFRMQTSAPELIDLSAEPRHILDMYGATPGRPSFANNCILARRLVERGVRFIQLYHTDWDHHGDSGNTITAGLDGRTAETDRPCAALLRDLKQRGLLENTLVVWGGEFGRTPMGENRETVGRNHHIDAYTMWFSGGGIKPGISIGQTDEFGFAPVEDRMHVHDVQATILHLLGFDHRRLTFRFQGRDFRLTDVHGRVMNKLLA